MGTVTTTTPAERYQALQKLEAAYHQPDGNMFFTYNGASYRSVGVNGDGTLSVIDQTTGRMLTLDPVNVYAATRAAAGDPLPPPPSPSSASASAFGATGPSGFSNAMGQIGMYSGLLNMAAQIKGVSKFLANITHLGANFAVILGSVTAFLSAYGLFKGIQSLFKGQFSAGALLNLGMSAFGLATGVNSIILAGTHSGFMATLTNPAGWAIAGAVISGSVLYGSINSMILNGVTPGKVVTAAISTLGTAVFTNMAIAAIHAGITASFHSIFTAALFTGPWGWIAAGAMILFSILWSLFHRPPPEQVAAQNLTQSLNPVIWTPGPLAVVAVGTVAILMGWAKNQAPPAMASLTVPAYYVNQVLAASGVGNINLKSTTPTVIVEPGDGRVVIVSPNGTDAHGNPLVTLQTYILAKNLQFVSSPKIPPEGAYIPFFLSVNGKVSTKVNPILLNALNIQDKMLLAILSGTLLTHDAMNALNVAAASNKYGVNPGN